MKIKFLAAAIAAIGVVVTTPAANAQTTVTTPSSLEYERSGMWRTFFGETWREVWREPITVPVLDLATFGGGLQAFKAGGNQSRTLRLKGKDGRTYIFRSVNKDVQRRALPEDLRQTPAGGIIQDQTSAMYPSAPVAIEILQDALGLLHAPTQLVSMPDDPQRLGEFREIFANTLGFIEERPEEAEKGTPTFAGAEKIQGTEELFEDLEKSMEDRFESRDYLTARLLDFIIGDTDRGADQWRFAKFETGERDLLRPIPRDRDYAFMNANGLIPRIATMIYPKLTNFSDDLPRLKTLVFMTREFDRSHLIDISREQWDSTVAFVQQRLTDQVIDRAIAELPEPHQRLTGAQIREGLRERRDDLDEIAAEYYAMVNTDADIFASDEDENAIIERNPDGTVTVRIWREKGSGERPVFERRFAPAETDEIRLFAERGNDRVLVRGNAEESIEVRVIGGEGDDILIDSSRVASGDKTHFYDAHGRTTLIRGANTRFSDKPFVTAPPKCALDEEDCEDEKNPRILMEERRGRQQDLTNSAGTFIDQKTKLETTRSWGKTGSWHGLIGYREGDGVLIGFGPTTTDYGFRRNPYEWQTAFRLLIAPLELEFGVTMDASRYFENSPWSVGLRAHASELEANRFFGYGNNTPLIRRSQSIANYDEVLVLPQIRYDAGQYTHFAFGPEARYVQYDRHWDGTRHAPGESSGFGQVGANIEMIADFATRTPVQQRGFAIELDASAFPKAWDVEEAFGDALAVARAYLPLGRATAAFRMGGQKVWGDSFPVHDAAFVGGHTTLRGYSWNRFAGDAAAFGGAELRVPLFRLTLLTRGTLGVIGFGDAGRVWFDGVSEGDWHTSYGGGLWFGSLGQAVSFTYAQGEEGRFYINTGLPF